MVQRSKKGRVAKNSYLFAGYAENRLPSRDPVAAELRS
jgi:hypothetical protein